jgi:hypothetical protein
MQISLNNTSHQLSRYSIAMISRRFFVVLALSLVYASAGHGQPLDQAAVAPSPVVVVVQPHEQVTQDLTSAAPESTAKPQPADDITAQLTAYRQI